MNSAVINTGVINLFNALISFHLDIEPVVGNAGLYDNFIFSFVEDPP